MNPNDQDQAPSGKSSGGPLASIFKAVIYFFAFIAAIVVKPAQTLTKEAYGKDRSGFAFVIGLVTSIVGSIGFGYMGFQHGVPLQWWLGSAIVAPFAIYWYGWPLVYLGLRSWAFKFSEFLWNRVVDIDDSESKGSKWLSVLLAGLVQVVIVAVGVYAFWTVMHHVHDYLGWDNIFAWGVGVVAGGVLAVGGGLAVSAALWQVGMPTVAILTGIALAYFFGIDLNAHLPAFVQPFASRYATTVRHGGEVLQVLAWAGYIFPLLHIIISRMFGWVGKYWNKLMDATYNDGDQKYLSFLCQALNLAVTGFAGYHAFGYASTFGFGLWLAVPATAVAALAAYLIGGAVLSKWSNFVVGILASVGAGYYTFGYVHDVTSYGTVGAIVAGVLAALANGFLVYPLVYQGVKLLANPLLASWLSKPLSEFYKTVSDEVFSSISKTYDDKTPYVSLFVHVVNIAAAVGVYFLVGNLMPMIHLEGWLSVALPVLLTVSSYLFVGRLLVAAKTPLVGFVTALAAGAFIGVEVFAHFNHNWWYAVPAFIGAALFTGFAVFPVTYVVTRAGLEAIRASSWAGVFVTKVYNFFWGFVQKFWVEFVAVYRRISLSFAPIWANVSKTWDEAWESAKKAWNDAFDGKNKK